jgi:hypothetical protein
VLSVEPALDSIPEASPAFETDRRAAITAPARREARIGDSTNAYYSPDPTTNYMMDGGFFQEERVGGQLSPHSMLNTPAPRTPISETSTPVRFSGFGPPTSFPGGQDFAYTPPQSRWHRSVPSRHSHVQPEFSTPATGIPNDLMMQTLRVLPFFLFFYDGNILNLIFVSRTFTLPSLRRLNSSAKACGSWED